MKNPLVLFINWLKRLYRAKKINKRNEIYEDITATLSILNKEKVKQQAELIQEIKDNWKRISGLHYGSEFIPNTGTKKSDIISSVNKEYFFKMQSLGISINDKLEFKCD